MAFYPLSLLPPQYINPEDGELASGFILTAYRANTTTEIPMYANSSGTSVGTSLTLNSGGYPEFNGNIITPFLDSDETYKFILTNPETEIEFTIDGVTAVIPSASDNRFSNLEAAKASGVAAGEFIWTDEYTANSNRGASIYLVKTTGEASSDGDVIDGYANHTMASGDVLILQTNGTVHLYQVGATSGSESYSNIAAAITLMSAGGNIDYGSAGDNYTVSGGELPFYSNQVHLFNGATLTRPSLDNSNAMFYSDSGVDNVKFIGGFIVANTDTSVGSSGGTAACIYVEDGSNIVLDSMDCQGGASGFQAYGTERITIDKCNFTGNILSGMSGIVKKMTVTNTRSRGNGFDSGGFTHEFYIINSSDCKFQNCEIGDCLDDPGYSLNVKNKASETTYAGFTQCTNNTVRNCSFFGDDGIFFTGAAAEGELPADQLPHLGHIISDCKFTTGSGLRVFNPENFMIKDNVGEESCKLVLTSSSTEASYEASMQIKSNTFGSLEISALASTDTDEFRDNVVLIDNTFLASSDVIDDQATFGGQIYCTIHDIYTPNASSLFSTAAQADFESGKILYLGEGDYPELRQWEVESTNNSGPYTPEVGRKGRSIQMFGLVNAATINDTASCPDGTMLTFGVQANGSGSNRVLTFNSNYRLTDAWEATKDTNTVGQFVFMTFIRRSGVWHQLYDAGWT